MESEPMWWLVIARPLGETKEPEPPLLKRMEAFMARSRQASVRSKSYFFLSRSFGRLLRTHMPSSARAVRAHRKKQTRARSFMVDPCQRALDLNGSEPGRRAKNRCLRSRSRL